MRRSVPWAVGAVLVLGAVLRLVWVGDMEYKYDEAYLVVHANGSHPWAAVGEASSAGLPNPGLGLWMCSALVRGLGLSSPTQLARGVMVLNVLALLALALFAWRIVSHQEREPWLWATALIALNPTAVLFSRKIWIQSFLPAFSVAFLVAWWRRASRVGSFAWGAVGGLIGQVHLTGFFFAAGVVIWTALFDRAGARWRWWLAGTVVGLAPAVPWLHHVLTHSYSARRTDSWWPPRFWGLWLTYPLGVSILDSFDGPNRDSLLAWPGSSHVLEITLAAAVVVGALIILSAALPAVHARALSLRWVIAGRDKRSGLVQRGALWGYGLLLTATGTYVYRHYVTAAFALPFLLLAMLALAGARPRRWLLTGLVVLEALLTVQYLTYVHRHHGARGSDYGVAYDAQRATDRPHVAP